MGRTGPGSSLVGMSNTDLSDRGGFTAQVDVEDESKTLNSAYSSVSPGKRPKVTAIVMFSFVCVVGALLFGSRALQRWAPSVFPTGVFGTGPGARLGPNKPSVATGHLLDPAATSRTVGSVLSLCSKVWSAVRQRPKVAVIVASVIAVFVIGATVVCVLLLCPSLRPDLSAARDAPTPPSLSLPPNSLSNGAIVGIVISGVVGGILLFFGFSLAAERMRREQLAVEPHITDPTAEPTPHTGLIAATTAPKAWMPDNGGQFACCCEFAGDMFVGDGNPGRNCAVLPADLVAAITIPRTCPQNDDEDFVCAGKYVDGQFMCHDGSKGHRAIHFRGCACPTLQQWSNVKELSFLVVKNFRMFRRRLYERAGTYRILTKTKVEYGHLNRVKCMEVRDINDLYQQLDDRGIIVDASTNSICYDIEKEHRYFQASLHQLRVARSGPDDLELWRRVHRLLVALTYQACLE